MFYSLLYNSLIQDSVREGSEGKEDQREEAALGEDLEKEEGKKTLSVRVTIIRKLIYHCMTTCHLQCFSYFSTLFFFMKPVFSASLFDSISVSGHVAYSSSLSQSHTY